MVHVWSEEVKAMDEMKGECTKELCRARDALAEPFLLVFFFFFLYTKQPSLPFVLLMCFFFFLSHY